MQMNFSERFNEFWKASKNWRCRQFFSIESIGSRNISPPMENISNDLHQRLLLKRFLLA
jgi:hypothetical protein